MSSESPALTTIVARIIEMHRDGRASTRRRSRPRRCCGRARSVVGNQTSCRGGSAGGVRSRWNRQHHPNRRVTLGAPVGILAQAIFILLAANAARQKDGLESRPNCQLVPEWEHEPFFITGIDVRGRSTASEENS